MQTCTEVRTGDTGGSAEVRSDCCLYIHVDPRTRELLYVGISATRYRHLDYHREKPHRDRLRTLLLQGYTKGQISHFVCEGLSYARAVEFKRALIELLKPIFNARGREDWRSPEEVFDACAGGGEGTMGAAQGGIARGIVPPPCRGVVSTECVEAAHAGQPRQALRSQSPTNHPILDASASRIDLGLARSEEIKKASSITRTLISTCSRPNADAISYETCHGTSSDLARPRWNSLRAQQKRYVQILFIIVS